VIEAIRAEIARALRGLTPCAIGTVEEIDLKAYQVRCRIATSGQLTNWLRIGTDQSGDGTGMLVAPNVGDEVLIQFLDWNAAGAGIVVRRLYGKDAPPALEAGQLHFVHESGTEVLVKKDGSIEVTGAAKSSTSAEGEVSVSSKAKVTISAQGVCEILGTPTVNLNGSSFSAVIFEQLQTALMSFQSLLASHTHLCAAPAAPSGPPLPPPVLVLTPAQSQKVKLGG